MTIKLDMNKAYDRIEWGYLRMVLTKLGFFGRWVNLLMQCVSTVTYSIIVNGSPCVYIHPSRGLRQEDPFSPYLFFLCVEGFSAFIDQGSLGPSAFQIDDFLPSPLGLPFVAGYPADQQSSMKASLICSLFSGLEANAILCLPLSFCRPGDKLLWHYDSKGIFMVKSAYDLAACWVLRTGDYDSSSHSGCSLGVLWKRI
ncbi:hypothetical protein ACFX14_003591 [Malus domestica]